MNLPLLCDDVLEHLYHVGTLLASIKLLTRFHHIQRIEKLLGVSISLAAALTDLK